jgi:hypothetical protein
MSTKMVSYSRNAAFARAFIRESVRSLSSILAAILVVVICGLAVKGLMTTVFDVYMSERIVYLSEVIYKDDTKIADLSGKVSNQAMLAAFYKAQTESLVKANNELVTTVVSSAADNAKLRISLAAEKDKGPIDKLAEEKFVVSTKEALTNATSTVVQSASNAYDKTVKLVKAW